MLDALLIDRSLLGAPIGDPAWIAEFMLKVWAINVLGYVIPAGLVYLVLFVAFRRQVEPMRVQKHRRASGAQMRREFANSMSTVTIFAVIGMGVVTMAALGWTRFYFKVGDFGWGYLILSFVVLTIIHDTYFYWTHRALHHPRLFRRVHRVHHRSATPTPWSCYSFTPGEAVVQAAFYPVVVMLIPYHPAVIVVFATYQIVRNTLGHSGFDPIPPGLRNSLWFSAWSISSTHHDRHHSGVGGNYALYFSWWDNALGTVVPEEPVKTRAADLAEPVA